MRSCLIVGQYSAFAGLLIDRFVKEDWQVSTLSESGGSSPKAFVHYTYKYSSEDLTRVIESCRPNVLIYLGAYDNAYRGQSNKAHLKQQFVANVSNLLMCASRSGVRHFIYLSSEQVFDRSSVVDLTEEMVPRPDTEHGTILRQGEMLVLDYNSTATMEATVLRLCNLYYTPHEAVDCSDIVTSKCLSAARGDTIHIDSKYSYSVLNSGDAIEAINKLVSAEKRQKNLYHVASDAILDDEQLMRIIQSEFVRELPITDETSGASTRRALSGRDFNSEFNFSTRIDYQQEVPEIVRFIQSQLSRFVDKSSGSGSEKTGKFLRTVISVAEVAGVVFLCYLLTNFFSFNSALSSIDLYLLCTLLFSAYYGSKIGVLSSSLCTIAYLIAQSMERSGLKVLVDMKVYVWIAQIFIVALAVGYVRDVLNQTKKNVKLETDYLNDRLTNIHNINESNVRIKDFFEERVVDSNESVGYIYNILQTLDGAKKTEVMFEATRILMQMMQAGSVSIYQVLQNGYMRVVSSTNDRSRSLGKSIRKDDYPSIFDQLETRRAYVNRSLNPDLPNMIGTLTDADDNISYIVMLWDVGFDHMTLYHLNLLQVICKLISSVVIRSIDYLEITKQSRVIDNTEILNETAFEEIIESYKKASDNHLTEYCLIDVKTNGRTAEEMNAILKGSLRFTDSMGLQSDGAILHILLTNTNVFDSRVVIDRLKSKGLEAYAVML